MGRGTGCYYLAEATQHPPLGGLGCGALLSYLLVNCNAIIASYVNRQPEQQGTSNFHPHALILCVPPVTSALL